MVSTLQAFSDDLAGAVASVGRHVVAIAARRRIPSSGVVWRDGVVVTAQHTIQREEDIVVTLADGTESAATLVGRDEGTDIAVLRLAGPTGGAVEVAPPDAIRLGGLVLALGRPGRQLTAALGVVSAVGDAWRTWHGGQLDRRIRLDISIYDGFSGGPLVDGAGRVLGINTSTLLRGAPTTVPGSTVDRVATQLLEHGHVPTGYLGVAMHPVPLPEQLARALNLTARTGLMIAGLEPQGPADAAGLLLGDVITGMDGQPVSDPAEVVAFLDATRIGRPVRLQLVRAGGAVAITVTVGNRPTTERK
ncbi:MAG TPA: trypsin-like peptidase domain-containing protein [Gemmatimonadales bacterium]|nr:trypsin-like peptidase domain-containing protein [Gemmatimonadales bacterium]